MTERKTEVVHMMLKRDGLTPELALAKAKSRLWWRVALVFSEDARFFVWTDEGDE